MLVLAGRRDFLNNPVTDESRQTVAAERISHVRNNILEMSLFKHSIIHNYSWKVLQQQQHGEWGLIVDRTCTNCCQLLLSLPSYYYSGSYFKSGMVHLSCSKKKNSCLFLFTMTRLFYFNLFCAYQLFKATLTLFVSNSATDCLLNLSQEPSTIVKGFVPGW